MILNSLSPFYQVFDLDLTRSGELVTLSPEKESVNVVLSTLSPVYQVFDLDLSRTGELVTLIKLESLCSK